MTLRLLGRPLGGAERKTLARSLERFRRHFARVEDARDFLAAGASPVDTMLEPTEHAAWMLVASQLLNTDFALNK